MTARRRKPLSQVNPQSWVVFVYLIAIESLPIVGGAVALSRSDTNSFLAILAIVGGSTFLILTAIISIWYLRLPVVKAE